jgi:hypothetical protein
MVFSHFFCKYVFNNFNKYAVSHGQKKGEEIGFRITNEYICNLSGGSARNVNRKYRK